MITRHWHIIAALALCGAPAVAQQGGLLPGIRARVEPVSCQIPLGRSVDVLFTIENTTDDPITLTVPGAEPEIPSPEMGLPLSHVFSGRSSSGVAITTDTGRKWDTPLGYRAGSRAPILIIAPHSTVGTTLDLRQHFPALRGAGRFRIAWEPYKGAVKSETATVTIATRKRAEIATDDGTMTLRFFYEEAPNHVANFIELALAGFYNGKTFHRLELGYFILGGCPRGDGTGIRPDGKRIAEEFNNHPHEKGSVSMALLGDDPDSGSCQFFICNTRQKDWDGRYTVFAQLVGNESFETLDRLMATPVDDLSRPLRTLYIRSVHIVDEPSDTSSNAP